MRWNRTRVSASLLAFVLAALSTLPASAFEQGIRSLVYDYVFPERSAWLRERVTPLPRGGSDSFRNWLYEQSVGLKDEDLVERFRGRYPTVEVFDRWAFKEFLGLDPKSESWGIDRVHDNRVRRGELLDEALSHPELDGRNRDRFAHDTGRRVLHDGLGAPLPADPATVRGWALQGWESGFAAEFALPSGIELSDSPQVLESEAWRYSKVPEVRSFCAERAQTFTDLSLLSVVWGQDGAEYLSLLYGGHAQYYLVSAGDPLSNIHFGIAEFRNLARRQSFAESLRSIGGLLQLRLGEEVLADQIADNHRILGRQLWAIRVLREEEVRRAGGRPRDERVAAALDALSEDSVELTPVSGPFFASSLVESLAEKGATEAPELLASILDLSVRDIRRGAFVYRTEDDAKDPTDFVSSGPDVEAALTVFNELNTRAMRRTGTALRSWMKKRDRVVGQLQQKPEVISVPDAPGLDGQEEKPLVAPTVDHAAKTLDRHLTRLVRARLDELDGAEVRRAAWIPQPIPELSVRWGYPLGLLALILLVIVLLYSNARWGSQQRRPKRGLRF